MKQRLHNEHGYILLLVFAVIIIFTVMGLSLMTLTSSGIQKNRVREDVVQATDLADKGITFMLSNIQTDLAKFIDAGNIDKAAFKTKLSNLLSNPKLNCETGGIEIPGDTGITTVCIDVKNIKNVYIQKSDGTRVLQELKKEVPIKSTGLVNGKEKITTTRVVIGTDAVPDQLKYAISTNSLGGADSNLYLHGGVEIQGDVKVDGNLIVSNNATWFSGQTPIWQPSVTAKLTPSAGTSTPKIIFSQENKAVYELKTLNYYDEHIAGAKLNTNRYTKYDPSTTVGQQSISNLFFNSPQVSVLTRPSIPKDTVEITTKITEKYNATSNKKNYTTNLTINTTTHETRNFKKTDAVFVSDTATEKVKETYTYFEEVCVRYFLIFCIERGQQEKIGERWVDKNTYKLGNMNIDGGIYNNRGQLTGKNDITLVGTYFVYGNLTIKNVNLKTDAIIYVQGNVDISESTIRGVNDAGTLILFANGNIDMYNMSVNSGVTDATRIKGFFYTKQDMLMYGVGSNIHLTGGISARRLILTAVRGDTKNGYLKSTEQDDLINNIAKHYSRLKITYDQDLISSYTTFHRDEEEEYIRSLSEPEIIERSS